MSCFHQQVDYCFRPRLFGRVRYVYLQQQSLIVDDKAKMLRLELSDIIALRVYQHGYAKRQVWECEITHASGQQIKLSNRHWNLSKGRLPQLTLHTKHFFELLHRLLEGLRQINPQALYYIGPSMTEWALTCIVGVSALAVAVVGAALMWREQKVALPGLAFIALSLVYLPMLWPVMRSSGPKLVEYSRLTRYCDY